MEIEEDKLRELAYNLDSTLRGFNIHILNPQKTEYDIEYLKRVSTGYQPILGTRIHWGLMINDNHIVYPLTMHSDDFTVVLDHYDGVMVSKTRSEFTLSSKYTGWYIILENLRGVNV